MDDRAKFQAAYREWTKSRRTYESWLRKTVSGRIPVNKVRGLKLARDVQRKLFAFMAAGKPFVRG